MYVVADVCGCGCTYGCDVRNLVSRLVDPQSVVSWLQNLSQDVHVLLVRAIHAAEKE